MMMTMDQPTAGFGDFGGAYASDPFAASQSSSPPIGSDPDVDWSVFENAERYLLRDDSAWITRLSKDFWWNLDRISEMISYEIPSAQAMNNRPGQGKYNQQQPQQQQQQQHFMQQSAPPAAKPFMQQAPPPMQFGGAPPRKIVGQRSGNNAYRNGSMFNNGFASPPPSSSSSSSSSGSTIVRPPANNHGMGGGSHNNNNFNIPDKSNFFQAFSSMSIAGGPNDQDIEYNPFQSKISFDNNMWGASAQQPIPWQ